MSDQDWKREELGGDFGSLESRVVKHPLRGGAAQKPLGDLVRVTDPYGDVLYCHPDDLATAVDSPAIARRGLDLGGALIEEIVLSKLPTLAAAGVEAIVGELEGRLHPYFGLKRLPGSADALEHPERWAPQQPEAGQRALVLLHGAFSVPHHSFGGLSTTSAWAALQQEYRGRIFAFGSRTVTESPVASAITLLKALPDGAKIDLASYSRGGLVGELLADPIAPAKSDTVKRLLAARDKRTLPARKRLAGGWDAFTDAENARLKELSELHANKAISVGRHTRIASPVGGTPLAGRRLDRWLSFVLRMAGLAAGPSLIFGFLKRTALEMIRGKADATLFPGIGAMDPDGPLVRAIAQRGPARKTATTAITGAFRPEGALARVGMLAVDYFFGEPNDLVVPTRAMWLDPVATPKAPQATAGDEPAVEERVSLDDEAAHHFGYFSHPTVRAHLAGAGERRGVSVKLGLNAFGWFDRALAPKGEESADRVFLLPGTMGTSLGIPASDGNDAVPIWLRFFQVTKNFAALKLKNEEDPSIVPLSVLGAYYGDLLDGLSAHFRVIPWGYDWRKSILGTARALAKAVEAELAVHKGAVHLVAHSMGGVVAMAMIHQLTDTTLTDFKKRGSTLVMMGTPIRGAVKALKAFTGDDFLLDVIDSFDGGASPVDTVRTFSGALQLLSDEITSDKEKLEALLAVCKASPPAVAEAHKFWKARKSWLESGDPFKAVSAHYIFGRGSGTMASVLVKDGTAVFEATDEGDGTVPWASAFASKANDREPTLFGTLKYWNLDADHGTIPDRVRPEAIRDLLVRGAPEYLRGLGRGLPSRRATRSASSTSAAEADPSLVAFAPIDRLALAAFGSLPGRGTRHLRTLPVTPVSVEIVHGSVHASPGNGTLVLGVFEGEPPQADALLLDRRFGARLRTLWESGAWPTQLGADAYVPGDRSREVPSVLVVNLGRAARLSRRSLRDTLSRVLRARAIAAGSSAGRGAPPAERKPARRQGPARNGHSGLPALFAFSILGADGPNPLGPEEALGAIVESVVLANRAIRQTAQGALGRAKTIEQAVIYEPYRDIAGRLLHALHKLDIWTTVELSKGEVEVLPELGKCEAFFGSMPISDGANETWNRIAIHGRGRKGTPVLEIITGHGNAARRRSRLALPPAFIGTASLLADNGGKALATAGMFAAASNRFLREAILEGQGLVFDVNAMSAAIPWELLLPNASEETPSPRDAVVRVFLETESSSEMMPASARKALVVGNPTPAGTVPLLGAEDEAADIRGQLAKAPGGSWDVTGAATRSSTELLTALGGGRYRVLHLATHGRVTPTGKGEVYLGDGFWEGADLVDRMSEVPQLVFLNACYSGAALGASSAMAATLAQAFFRKGVRAMVVTGWAVGDAAARTFASVFYEELLDGSTFGRAVRRARFETRKAHRGDNTWAAFQCYGEPSTVIVPEARLDRRLRRLPSIATPEALVDYVISLHGDAKVLARGERARVKDALSAFEKALAHAFDGDVWRKVGLLWADLDDAQRAAHAFDKALAKPSSKFDVLAWAAWAHLRVSAGSDGAPLLTAEWIAKLRTVADTLRSLKTSHAHVTANALLQRKDALGARKALEEAVAASAPKVRTPPGTQKFPARADYYRAVVDTRLLAWARDSTPLTTVPGLEGDYVTGKSGGMNTSTYVERLKADHSLLRALESGSPSEEKVAEIVEEYARRLAGRSANLWARAVHDQFAALLGISKAGSEDATRRLIGAVVERLKHE